jgi:hypothetical protein
VFFSLLMIAFPVLLSFMLGGILLQLLVLAPATSFLSSVYISDHFLMIHLSFGLQLLLKHQDGYKFHAFLQPGKERKG